MALTLLLFFIQQFTFTNEECECTYPIFYAELGRSFEAPCELPATISFFERSCNYTLTIYDCKGAAKYIAKQFGTKKEILNLDFENAVEVSNDTIYNFDDDSKQTMTVDRYYLILSSKNK